jgi:hypothetical protein
MLPSGVILAQKTQKAAFPRETAGKAASFFHAAVEQAFRLDSVGINRPEVVNERVIQERSSEPS